MEDEAYAIIIKPINVYSEQLHKIYCSKCQEQRREQKSLTYVDYIPAGGIDGRQITITLWVVINAMQKNNAERGRET